MIDQTPFLFGLGLGAAGLAHVAARKVWFPKHKNSSLTSKSTIVQQMNELRPLPMCPREFEEWSDRIISGAMLPTDDPERLHKSVKATLAVMLQALGPQEDHKPDAYFIHSLRKAAINETARHKFITAKTERDAEDKEKATSA